MATTAFNSAGVATIRRSADRLARPSIPAQIGAFFARMRGDDEARVVAQFAGQRWCDTTERKLVDALGESNHGVHW